MEYTLIIDGGAGRVVTAIPALEKFVERNPKTNILVNYWTPILWGNSKLQDLVFDDSTKGLFDKIKDTKVFKPEPYYNSAYNNGQINLVEAFNLEINAVLEFSKPILHVTPFDSIPFENDISKVPARKKKIVGFQPFGSTANINGDDVTDDTYRSLSLKNTRKILSALKQKYTVVIFVHSKFAHLFQQNLEGCIVVTDVPGIRYWMAAAKRCDYIVGIDSVVQHMAYSFDVPGSIIMGSTNTVNVTYPSWFTVFEKENKGKKYFPMRFCEFDIYLSKMVNHDCINFSEDEMNYIIEQIMEDIKNKTS